MDFVPLPLATNKENERGIVYISKIPHKMTPGILRELLSKYGSIGRIFLTPKPLSKPQKRKSNLIVQGNGFSEGWVEFMNKKEAKLAATLLNCNSIGITCHKKIFTDDLWNIKYLSKFTWSQLTDQLAYEKAVKDQKLRAELAQAKKNNQIYLQKVEKAHEIEAIESKKPATVDEKDILPLISKRFKQRKPVISNV